MKIIFNSLGIVTDFQVESTDSLRQGTIGNRLVAIFEDLSISNYIPTLNFTRSDGSKISNVGMDITGANQCEVKFDDPWYFALDGNATMTVFLHDGEGNIVAQGQHRITIESTDYDPTAVPPIDLEQYDYLLEQISKRINKNGETELGASMNWTGLGGASIFSYSQGQSLAETSFEFGVPVSFTSSIDAENMTIRGDEVATKDFVTSETDKCIKKQGTTKIGALLWLDANSRAVLSYNSATNLFKFVANLEATNINLTDGSITSNGTLYLGGNKLSAETSDTALYMEDYFQLTTGGDIRLISDGAFTWNGNPVATTTYVTEQITSILNGYATENYVQQQIAEAVSNAYKWSGSKTVAELNALTVTSLMHGNVYNVTSDGVLNQGNVSVIAGDNVAIVWDAQNNTYLWDKLAGTFTVDLSGYLQKSTSFNSVYATTSNGSQIMIGYSESPTGSGGYLVLRKSNGQISVPETPIADDDATSKKYVDDEHALLDNRVTALEIEVGNQQKVYGIRFTGNAVNGVRLNDAYGLTFDLSQGINDFAIEELFAKIHEVETTAYNSAGQALVDSSGATLKNKFIYIPNFYFKQTLTQDANGNDVVSWFVTEKEKVGFTPIFKNTDGTVPTAFLVGKYETNFGDDTETVVGSFTGKKPVVNVNRDYVHGKTTYVLDASLDVSTLQKVDQSFPKKAWDAIAILISIVTGTRHHQSVFYGITGDSLLNPQDAAIASYQEAGAVNSFVCQKTNYIRTKSEVGSKITIYSSSTQSRRWEQHTITAIEDDVPETGLSKITFDGTATYIASGTVRIGLHCGEPAGATDSISGDFGNLATDNMHAFKVFGIENYFGNFWTILGGAAIEQTWDADAEVAHNKLMLPSGDNYEPGVSYTSFVTTDVELALTEAYVKRLAFKDSVFVPSITGNGASSTTYYADYYYTDKRTAAAPSTAYRTFLGGGHYYSGAYAGSFSFACDRGWTYSVWGCGFRSFLLIQ